MRRERSVLFALFVMCLVAAAPLAWGDDGLHLETATLADSVETDLSAKVTLCHRPPGNPAHARTIVVGQAALAAHLAHGDSLGACPLACAGVPSAVPKTGQTGCWDENGSSISCAGTGQDGEYQVGASVSPRFMDNADGTVEDSLTGLIWLKNASCFGVQTWTNALAVSNTLASGACGLADGSVIGAWRLPNVKELQSLIDFGQFYPAFPPGNPFTGVQSDNYWSSTTHAVNRDNACVVSLSDGVVVPYVSKTFAVYVWPVRGGQ